VSSPCPCRGCTTAYKQAINDVVGMLEYNTIISIYLTCGDEAEKREAQFVLSRIKELACE
jgi:hypothetical protein